MVKLELLLLHAVSMLQTVYVVYFSTKNMQFFDKKKCFNVDSKTSFLTNFFRGWIMYNQGYKSIIMIEKVVELLKENRTNMSGPRIFFTIHFCQSTSCRNCLVLLHDSSLCNINFAKFIIQIWPVCYAIRAWNWSGLFHSNDILKKSSCSRHANPS